MNLAEHIVVASRKDHPKGYGLPDLKAHGYSTLVIPCDNDDQVNAVIMRLDRGPVLRPFRGVDRTWGWSDWYGGWFDYVCHMKADATITAYRPLASQLKSQVVSLGDNRAITLVTARDLLRENAGESMRALHEYNNSNQV